MSANDVLVQLVGVTSLTSIDLTGGNLTITASGGTDGRTGVVSATLIGSDSTMPKTGLYALRQLQPQVGIVWLVGCAGWAIQVLWRF